VSDPRALFRRYLEQQIALGQPAIVWSTDRRIDGSADRGADGQTGGQTDGMAERRDVDPSGRRSVGPSTRPSAAPPARRWAKDLPAIPTDIGFVLEAPTQDLFSTDPLAAADMSAVERLVHACTNCGLHEKRRHAVPGEGPREARLVVVGEGPGATEDEQGRPFVGRAGELLTEILAAIDCPRETVYICNVVKCRPPENRKPAADEIEACMPYLHRQLAIIRPKVILAMGGTAAEALLHTKASLGSLRNKVHQYRGIPLIVTYHPAALLRNPNWKRPTWDDVRIARQLLDQ